MTEPGTPAQWLISIYDRCAADDAEAVLLLRYDKDRDPAVRSQPMIQVKTDDPGDGAEMQLSADDYRDNFRWWL